MREPGRTVAVRNLHPRLRTGRGAVARIVRVLDASHRALSVPGSGMDNRHGLSVAFLTDAALARLHADFLGDPSETDVITFPGWPSLGSAGEICVSVDAAVRQAVAPGRAFSQELTLYLVHGWLHLAGHDDRAPAARRLMRRAESRALAALRRAGAMPEFGLRGRGNGRSGFRGRLPKGGRRRKGR